MKKCDPQSRKKKSQWNTNPRMDQMFDLADKKTSKQLFYTKD